ncbi:DUF6542 domain-containing protein [Streptomyces sp. MZ04]|uniref:DUF6542 domain-containing protein n=1 Tax=Streptomyces sp. MZ04 TaxID=2559236 RepID=UPI00107EC2A8|nr:DUF6542 domain-containing protein [Streptomyces sp. MZ04]TGB08505.1 hypothetical protein E2651_19035 [Streptomyces sp. MZ04]
MEQHRTRPPQHPARPRRTAPLPPQGRPAESSAVYRAASRPRRPAPPFVRKLRALPLYRFYRSLRRMPNPRLTGLGSGLFCAATMFLLAFLLWLFFGGSNGALVAYGVLFVPVSALTALWVRPVDLVTAPVGVPLAFVAGLLPVSEGSGGFGGHFMGLITALALHAGWLYGGTLVAGIVVIVRRIRFLGQRRRARAAAAAAGPRARAPRRRMPAT